MKNHFKVECWGIWALAVIPIVAGFVTTLIGAFRATTRNLQCRMATPISILKRRSFPYIRLGTCAAVVCADCRSAHVFCSTDDYDRFTRSIHWRKSREVSKDENALIEELERELSAILAAPLGQWNQVADGYSNIWGRYTKDEFEKMTPSYPDPI